ncbi:unnamed protein product [Leuciscus chuanchicus]
MDNVTINVADSKGNVVMLTVSKDIAERMKNGQMFLYGVMEKLRNLSFVKPSTSQCPLYYLPPLSKTHRLPLCNLVQCVETLQNPINLHPPPSSQKGMNHKC